MCAQLNQWCCLLQVLKILLFFVCCVAIVFFSNFNASHSERGGVRRTLDPLHVFTRALTKPHTVLWIENDSISHVFRILWIFLIPHLSYKSSSDTYISRWKTVFAVGSNSGQGNEVTVKFKDWSWKDCVSRLHGISKGSTIFRNIFGMFKLNTVIRLLLT